MTSVTRPQLILTGTACTKAVLASLEEAGLDAATRLTTHITLFSYVRGVAVNPEMEAEASGMDGEEWMAAQEPALSRAVAQGHFPAVERIVWAEYDFYLDTIHEFGVQRLLDGIAALAERARPGPG